MGNNLPQTTPFITFKLGSKTFAIRMTNVVKLLEPKSFNLTKEGNLAIRGLRSVNDYILPVLNIRKMLGMSSSYSNLDFGVLVIKSIENKNCSEFGILINSMGDISEFINEEIVPFSLETEKRKNKLISGLIKTDNEYVFILDLNNISKQIKKGNVVEEINKDLD
ncbi:MAG: chemotaxis protein CheW [Salinivirgaceae bacterium]|nr:chemotaxis protein CheW [Salinivirgaceae bacterium]